MTLRTYAHFPMEIALMISNYLEFNDLVLLTDTTRFDHGILQGGLLPVVSKILYQDSRLEHANEPDYDWFRREIEQEFQCLDLGHADTIQTKECVARIHRLVKLCDAITRLRVGQLAPKERAEGLEIAAAAACELLHCDSPSISIIKIYEHIRNPKMVQTILHMRAKKGLAFPGLSSNSDPGE